MNGNYKQLLSTGLASVALLLLGSVSLIRAGSFDYYSVLGTLFKVIPASIIIGGLGWVMGSILDRKARHFKRFKLENVAKIKYEPENLNTSIDDIDNIETLTPRIEI